MHMERVLHVVGGRDSQMPMTTMMMAMMTAMAWRMRLPFPVCGPRQLLLHPTLSHVHLPLSFVSTYNFVTLPLGQFLVFVYPFGVLKFSHLNATTSWAALCGSWTLRGRPGEKLVECISCCKMLHFLLPLWTLVKVFGLNLF